MNWANSFFKKFRKPCLRTDGPTDRRTDSHRGDSSIPQFHLRWSGGIMRVLKYYVQNKALLETWKPDTVKWSITILLGIKLWNNKETWVLEFEGEQEIIFISPLWNTASDQQFYCQEGATYIRGLTIYVMCLGRLLLRKFTYASTAGTLITST